MSEYRYMARYVVLKSKTGLDKTKSPCYSSLIQGDTMNPLEALRYHVTGAIERGEREAIIEVSFNRVCCVCQASLDGNPYNPDLKTSHGYCEACLEAEFLKIGGQS